MCPNATQSVKLVRDRLLVDLPLFLDDPSDFFLAKKIDNYCSDSLKGIEGSMEPNAEFSKFVDVLFGCQQLDNFGEAWAPTKQKVREWIAFLKKFGA